MIYLLATNNPGKAKEIRPMFEAAGLTLISLADLGLKFEARETSQTFGGNALQKAQETAFFLKSQASDGLGQNSTDDLAAKYRDFLSPFNVAVLADDSGLAIDALNGEPGVDSALFMGRDTPYPVKCQGIIDKLAHVSEDKRTARFICSLVCLMPDMSLLTAGGTIKGSIAHTITGGGGFGYDPIFYYPPYSKTLAQLTKEEKNRISHRGHAIQKMIGLILNANFGDKRLPREN